MGEDILNVKHNNPFIIVHDKNYTNKKQLANYIDKIV